MPRPTGNILAEIQTLETELQGATATNQGYTIAGRSITKAQYEARCKRLDKLYQQYDRLTGVSPMIVRGVPQGLR